MQTTLNSAEFPLDSCQRLCGIEHKEFAVSSI